MINKNELRIGNKVEIFKNIFDVTQLFKGEVYLEHIEGGFGSHKYEFVNPIPLTPELLLKCGFDDVRTSQYGGFLILIGKGEKIRIIDDEVIGWHYPLHGHQKPLVHFLHQLQNLYWCLAGTELEINL